MSTGFTGISEGAAAGNGGRATPDGPAPSPSVWSAVDRRRSAARISPSFTQPCRPLPMGRPHRM
ncbi:hypothetical protein DA2_0980 [Desulfovibrio sp. A2]|nr:hypothetical protein DA2_0980 [Desulfovibrio sp. A2]